jgi:hypothetical protein
MDAVELWDGCYACYFGRLTRRGREDIVERHLRNRAVDERGVSVGLCRRLTECEREMSRTWFDACGFRDAMSVRPRRALAEFPEGDAFRAWLDADWCDWSDAPEHAFNRFCRTGEFVAPGVPSEAAAPGRPAGVLPCCTDAETDRPLVLLGRDRDGWSTFQGKAEAGDATAWHTAAREAAEEACEALGTAPQLLARFFFGAD